MDQRLRFAARLLEGEIRTPTSECSGGYFCSAKARSSNCRMKRWYGTPLSAAASLTAVSKSSGRRMLSRADLGANSNLTGRILLKSYEVRSTRSTNDSAARSVLTTGNFFLVMPDFFRMHEPRTDWPQPTVAIPDAVSEGNEDVSTLDRAPDAQKARFPGGMGGIRKHPDLAVKQPLDIVDRYAVPGALGPITLVPVESGDAFDHS